MAAENMEKAAAEGPDEGLHGREAAMEAKKAVDKGSPDDLGNTDAWGDIPLLDNLLSEMACWRTSMTACSAWRQASYAGKDDIGEALESGFAFPCVRRAFAEVRKMLSTFRSRPQRGSLEPPDRDLEPHHNLVITNSKISDAKPRIRPA